MIKMTYLYMIMLISAQMLSGMNAKRSYPTTSWIANVFRRGFYGSMVSKTTTSHYSRLGEHPISLYKDRRILENALKIRDLSTPVKANLKRELLRIDLQLKNAKS